LFQIKHNIESHHHEHDEQHRHYDDVQSHRTFYFFVLICSVSLLQRAESEEAEHGNQKYRKQYSKQHDFDFSAHILTTSAKL
jgi:hypothetical protein